MAGLRSGFEAHPIRSAFPRGMLGVAVVAAVFSLCLFGDCQTVRSHHALGRILGEATAVLGKEGTQWMVFLCAGIYVLAFTVLRERLGGGAGGSEDRKWKMEDGR